MTILLEHREDAADAGWEVGMAEEGGLEVRSEKGERKS